MTSQIDSLAVQALLDGTVELLAFSDYFTFSFEGDDVVFTEEQRKLIEQALGCKLVEEPVVVNGVTMLERMTIPKDYEAKATELLASLE